MRKGSVKPGKFIVATGFFFVLSIFGCASGSSSTPANACGGKSPLPHAPGSSCGACSTYECDGPDAVVCRVVETNECGGCSPLGQAPGTACGSCGIIVCDGTDHVTCQDPGANLCGGCAALEGAPGSACGTCGTWRCNPDGNSVTCENPDPNACGGCTPLSHQPGTPCGCGTTAVWTCNGANDVTCPATDTNACGGCASLPAVPGTACGTCGTWICATPDTLDCDDPGFNECGFCGALPHAVNSSCACSEGTWQCASGTSMACTLTTADTRATARELGSFSDTQDSFFSSFQALFPDEDTEDWFTSYCSDDYFGLMDIRARLVVPAGHDYDLCVYYDPGRSSSVGCTAGVPATFDGLNGCCSRNAGTTDEYVELDPDALGSSTDSGRFYYRVTFVSGPGTCATYQLQYAF